MKIRLTHQIEIQTTPENEQLITRQYTFNNPKYQEAMNFGRSTYKIDPFIYLIQTSDQGLLAPIGILDYLLQTFSPKVIDDRQTVTANIPFTGTLRPYQIKFVEMAILAKGGQMVAATGSGKTVSGIALASRMQQRTLILVNGYSLLKSLPVSMRD